MMTRRKLLWSMPLGFLALGGCGTGSITSPSSSGGPGAGALAAAPGTAPTHIAHTNHGDVVPEELALALSPGLGGAYIAGLATNVGAVVRMYDAHTGLALFAFASGPAAQRAAPRLQGEPAVLAVVPSYVMYAAGGASACAPVDSPLAAPLSRYQWNLPAAGFPRSRPRADGVLVAELDTGIAYEDYVDPSGIAYDQAPDLAGVSFAPGANEIDPGIDPVDDNRHGTHIAGILASATDPLGVAPGVSLMPVKVLDANGAGTEIGLAEGLVYAADHGARVVNMSLSFPESYFPSEILQGAVDYALRKGLVLVAAAGNFSHAASGDIQPVTFPAALQGVIAVGASKLATLDDEEIGRAGHRGRLTVEDAPWKVWHVDTDNLAPAGYTGEGAKLDVLAPGGELGSDLDGDGVDEAILAITFSPGCPATFAPWMWAGTSQATAHASGLAALLVAENPALDAAHVAQAIGASAGRPEDAAPAFDATLGHGYLRADRALQLGSPVDDGDDAPRLVLPGAYYADVQVFMHSDAGGEHAVAQVAIVDASLKPAPGVHVYGGWSGGVVGQADGVTGANGEVSFSAPDFAGAPVAAFEVDAVATTCSDHDATGDEHGKGDEKGKGDGDDTHACHVSVSRPRGFIDIDLPSLLDLSAFGAGVISVPSGTLAGPASVSSTSSGVLVSPLNVLLTTGGIVPPGGLAGGGPGSGSSGIIVSPSGPTPAYTATEPSLGIAFAPSVFSGDSTYATTVSLPSLSWGLSTMPINVAVDEAYLENLFPDVAGRIATSLGSGLPGSPMLFTAASFPVPINVDASLSAIPHASVAVFTYGAGLVVSPAGALDAPSGVLATDSGIIISPSHSGGMTAAPLVLDAETQAALAGEAQLVQDTLNAWWSYAIGLAPAAPTFSGLGALDAAQFGALGGAVIAYTAFSGSVAAVPVLSLPHVLAASGGGAPTSATAGDGDGAGASLR